MRGGNPFGPRLAAFAARLARRRLDLALVLGRADVRSLTGVDCDSACLLVGPGGEAVFHTDFRYLPMVRRVAPWLKAKDIRRLSFRGRRIGYESSIQVSQLMKLRKLSPRSEFVDVAEDISALRAVKTADEIARVRAAAALNDAIWQAASRRFRAGMTELDMARAIRRMMIDRGDGEAFDTIVCVGRNAAECHHVPDGTVWDGREPVLVDMGARLGGYCSDMTRNIVPSRPSRRYAEVYRLVLEANMRAIAAVRPGISSGELDAVARGFLGKNGFRKEFGHSLGHGVGLEIHEAPYAARKRTTVLEPGMILTVEPGVYIPGELGVRVEDLVLVTDSGCEVLTRSGK
ncbi:MAG: aminopeptidase P family protein [Kiritimatiellae bacterium]|nr:aminopeptidase P family protein [Kiritimatiellia bacterium]